MQDDAKGAGPRPVGSPSGLSPEEKKNLTKAAIFFAASIGLILGLKLLLGY